MYLIMFLDLEKSSTDNEQKMIMQRSNSNYQNANQSKTSFTKGTEVYLLQDKKKSYSRLSIQIVLATWYIKVIGIQNGRFLISKNF